MQNLRQKGTEGEELAVKYLQEKGFAIIKRNFHYGKIGEIDIVAKDKDCLVFVEVKARNSFKYGTGLDAITPSKQRQMVVVAKGYIQINNVQNTEMRFDVISIDMSAKPPQFIHIENAIVLR
ncbi:MAG: YraN family protein [Ignavibacteria bacterium GWF2_33_9]|nr:MAG: YraN family protein [Ignavibacteria bacterium GWF2_33_9]